jgi:hypothetical protein
MRGEARGAIEDCVDILGSAKRKQVGSMPTIAKDDPPSCAVEDLRAGQAIYDLSPGYLFQAWMYGRGILVVISAAGHVQANPALQVGRHN